MHVSIPIAAQEDEPVVNDMNQSRYASDWLHLGPIESVALKKRAKDGVAMSGFHTDYLGGEDKAVIQANQGFQIGGQALQAKRIRIYKKGWNKWAVGGSSLPGTTHYFYTELKVDKDQVRYLYADFEGSPQIWINGQKVLSHWRDEHILKPRDYGMKVELKAGINRCLVKIDSKQVWWLARLEFLTEAEYQAEIPSSIKSLTIESFDDEGIQLETWPRSFSPLYAWSAEIKETGGSALAMAKGDSSIPIQLFQLKGQKLIPGRVYHITVSSQPLDAEVQPLPKFALLAIYGSSTAGLKRIHDMMPEARRRAKALAAPWPKAYDAAFTWLERWLKAEGLENSKAAADQMYYAQMMVEGLISGKNPLQQLKVLRIPVWFEWKDSKGKLHKGNYGIYLPVDYGESGQLAPLIYSLTGGSFRDKVVSLKMSGSPEDPEKYEVDRAKVIDDRWFTVIPANFGGTWDVEMLEAVHAHVAHHFIHDQSRIYVRGGSLGGYGTWNWVGHRPNRFAAAVPRSGIADVFLSPRMTEVPIWVICGGEDWLVANVERGVYEVQAAGGILRYTLLPHNGHGGGRDRVETEEIRDWLYQHQLPAQARQEIDLYAHYGLNQLGISKVEFKEVGTAWELTSEAAEIKALGQLPNGRSLMRVAYALQKPARASGRLMGSPVFIHQSVEGELTWRFRVPARVDPKLIPSRIKQSKQETYRCVSVYVHSSSLDPKEIRALLSKAAKEQGLEFTGEERFVIHSIESFSDGRSFIEWQILVK